MPRRASWRPRIEKLPGYRDFRIWMVALAVSPLLVLGGFWLGQRSSATKEGAVITPAGKVRINWVDGDSGTIDGRPFRLYGVDAPEGSPMRAQCSAERVQANAALSAVRDLTNGAEIEIRRSHGFDRYDRELLSLLADGRDVASTLIATGHVKRWDYEAGDSKPAWCG